ncbi:c-type cytochrome [Stutzerimonas azotifigens]|uniref:c-type cytochrome n=1 Tax=Stutzerimonas azotifigens TaxID=291995 RepID=UPI0004036C47|nr:cytochrome c [Stutzerimonas azotifigens]
MRFKLTAAALLAALAVTACDRVDPNSPLGKRTAIFKEMLKTSEDLGGMLRGRLAFEPQAFAEGAAHLDQLSRQPWQYFPEVKDDERSSARDDVWEKQERFKALARDLEQRTAALVEAAGRQPLTPDQVVQPLQRVEDACEACHQAFRAY